MELRFDAILYSKLGNENSDAGHIKCSPEPHLARGSEAPHPAVYCNCCAKEQTQFEKIHPSLACTGSNVLAPNFENSASAIIETGKQIDVAVHPCRE